MKLQKAKYNTNGEAFSMHLQSESQLSFDQAQWLTRLSLGELNS